MARPSILFIMADQWHHLDFGYRNHPVVKTSSARSKDGELAEDSREEEAA
ncbi:MAG: hypothetical protein ACYTFI_11465 [Planctomycetota bacterium]|jgi:arylsulfatase A-like enzyme